MKLEFEDVFQRRLGAIKGLKAKLNLKEGTTAKCHKARSTTVNRRGIAETRERRNHYQSRLERLGNSGRRSIQVKWIDKSMR